jgi:hypothetical protein
VVQRAEYHLRVAVAVQAEQQLASTLQKALEEVERAEYWRVEELLVHLEDRV